MRPGCQSILDFRFWILDTGMGHGASGIGHGAWGMGHWALGIGHSEEGPRRAYLTTLENRYS